MALRSGAGPELCRASTIDRLKRVAHHRLPGGVGVQRLDDEPDSGPWWRLGKFDAADEANTFGQFDHAETKRHIADVAGRAIADSGAEVENPCSAEFDGRAAVLRAVRAERLAGECHAVTAAAPCAEQPRAAQVFRRGEQAVPYRNAHVPVP